MEWSQLPFILETDCSVAAAMILEKSINRSAVAAQVSEIKRILGSGREHRIVVVRREHNNVSHCLARIGRCSPRTAVWLRSGPEEIVKLCSGFKP